ncbi:MAG: hypothetical protein IPM50_02605 [Acidobacteriota bacterium]|nr:MAG: hypothetical protein IPM50_02605 [Acidobacteriota bacterium]
MKKERAETYDSEAMNRLEYTVFSGDAEVETAVTFRPCSDERYLQWLKEFKLKGDSNNLDEESMEATCRLYDEIAVSMDNVEFDGDDWRVLVPVNEKIDTINNLFAVAVFRPEKKGDGVRRLTATPSETYLTEAYFNGGVLQQTHVLKAQSIEWRKKYMQIQSKRFRKEITRGLNRPAKVEFIPQEDKLGGLYDEMVISTSGFAGSIPLRFKTAVIQHIFEESVAIDEKK